MTETSINAFLLMGQSNMAGRGVVDEVEPIQHPHIVMLRHGEWTTATEPLHLDKWIAGIGLGMSFALALAEAHPQSTIGLVPCALGGTSLDQWAPGGYLYRRALFEARQAMLGGQIQGILWHQGEGESSTEQRASSYGDRFVAMMQSFRKELGNEGIPIVVGELGEFLCRREGLDHFREVNGALRGAAVALPSCACVSSKDLDDKGDNLHFGSAALREFGVRYAQAYTRIIAESGVELI